MILTHFGQWLQRNGGASDGYLLVHVRECYPLLTPYAEEGNIVLPLGNTGAAMIFWQQNSDCGGSGYIWQS